MTPQSRFLIGLQAVVLIVVVLYFGQPVLLPLAIAVLLTFLLRPGVLWLQRHHIPRGAAIVLLGLNILFVIAGTGWVLTHQLHDLAVHLDEYTGHMKTKIESLQVQPTKAMDNVRAIFMEVADATVGKETPAGSKPSQEATQEDQLVAPVADATAGKETPPGSKPSHEATQDDQRVAPVEPPTFAAKSLTAIGGPDGSDPTSAVFQTVKVARESPSAVEVMRLAWDAMSTPLAIAVIVAVLVIFMLLEFEELRNRVLRLAGQSQLSVTTRTLEDASKRISRYLLANALVNGGVGLFVFLGLLLIGVDHAALWGFLAAVLRFVPYVGAFGSAALAIGMAFIQFPTWTQPALVAGLWLVLEIITNNVVEPLTYGRTAGVSTVALLVAATFWTWIWGPMGLVLSVPLTVMLAVFGKHIPQFEVLGILLGDEPALTPHQSFYQRLLAGDADEAAALLDEHLESSGRGAVYDQLVIPALALSERDRQRGELDEEGSSFIWHNIHELIEENAPTELNSAPRRIRVATCPAQDQADEIALTMLQHLAAPGCEFVGTSAGLMVSEKTAAIVRVAPDAVLISALGPGGISQVRYLCKRIRQASATVRIIVGRWGYHGDRERLTTSLRARGANQVVTTLQEALDALERMQSLTMSA